MKIRRTLKEKLEYTDDSIVTDPFGSYTGKPIHVSETPVQDMDDL